MNEKEIEKRVKELRKKGYSLGKIVEELKIDIAYLRAILDFERSKQELVKWKK